MRSSIVSIGVVLVVLGSMACTGRGGPLSRRDTGDDGGELGDLGVDLDAGPPDGGAIDAGADANARDASSIDATSIDAGTDVGTDVGIDASRDAGTDSNVGPDAGRCLGGARIGLYAADDLAAHMTVRDFLVPTGVLGSVGIGGPIEDVPGPPMVPARVPTLTELMGYDALFVWGSGAWNGDAFGNVLADYVDRGGGVVIAVFAQRAGGATGVAGRMLTAGYLPYVPSNYQFVALSLGTVAVPGHPIMLGVTRFSGTNIADHDGPLATGATLIASWSNARPLVATMQPSTGRTALLGLYPVRFWDTSTDGARMMANTLLWAARCQ